MELGESSQKKTHRLDGPASLCKGWFETTTQFYQNEVWLSTDDEGLDVDGVLHDDECPCDDCAKYYARIEAQVCQAPPLHVWTIDDLEPETIAAMFEGDQERLDFTYAEAQRRAALAAMADQFNTLARPVTLVDGPKLPALMVRDDGHTLLYESRLNSIFGEPGVGKTWLAIISAISAVRAGAHVLWWDFEDRPSTLATRLAALGAADLIDNESLRFANSAFLDDDDNNVLPYAQAWLMRGERPGLVVIDSCEAAGCPSDGGAVKPWFDKYVDPWLFCGAGCLLLDHVPKRREERPRGAIGSTHKLSRVDGAALFVSGQAWTKEAGGKVVLRVHKDRPGDLPATIGKPVATITATHADGVLEYTITTPDAEEAIEVTDTLLFEIAKLGSDGVTGSRAVRALVKTSGKVVDSALEDLINKGMVSKFKVKRAWVYCATTEGLEIAEGGE